MTACCDEGEPNGHIDTPWVFDEKGGLEPSGIERAWLSISQGSSVFASSSTSLRAAIRLPFHATDRTARSRLPSPTWGKPPLPG